MKKVILLRIGEVFLKGKNRGWFESIIIKNIKKALREETYKLHKGNGRYTVSDFDEKRIEQVVDKISKVFGLSGLSVAAQIETDKNKILEYIATIDIGEKSFRVSTNRADKRFLPNSQEFSAIAGSVVWQNNKKSTVDLHNPQTTIFVDIRTQYSYVYQDSLQLRGGLPVGSSGRALCLLSGGIDSPVAAYLMAGRGMNVDFLHFHSYPHTSEQAKQKVIDIAKKLKPYCGSQTLYAINVASLQEQTFKNCDNKFLITILRRAMMSIASSFCKEFCYDAVVSGESLGQVASQTIQSLKATDNMIGDSIVLRPLIAMDKEQIIKIAKDIDTFKISTIAHEDCCTVFLPKQPIIRPTIEQTVREESKIDLPQIMQTVLKTLEKIEIL